MATIKDIARLAGVSHGTVSNVINKKGNVSSDKIKLVEEATRELGFVANAQAQRLRKEDNRHIAVLMPDLDTEQYAVFYTAFSQRAQQNGFAVSLHITNSSAQLEPRCIADAITRCPACIVSVAPTPHFAAMAECPLPLILVDAALTQTTGNNKWFGFNHERIAQEIFAAKADGHPRIAFFGDSRNLSCDGLLSQTLERICRQQDKLFSDFSYERRFAHLSALELTEWLDAQDLVVVTSPERLRILDEMLCFKGRSLPQTVLLSVKHFTPHHFADSFELDYAHLGFSLAEKLATEQTEPLAAVTEIEPTGFRFVFADVFLHPHQQELSLLTLASPTTKAVTKLARHFKKTTGIQLRITELPYDELFNTFSAFGASKHDLVRMDMAWRLRFEQQICQPLTQCMPHYHILWESFLPELRPAYQSAHTLPIDPSVQVFLYRKDLLEDATQRRLYYEMTRETLRPPVTVGEFNKVARFFTKQYNSSSPIAYGTVSNHGLSTVAACDFLPRFHSMGGTLFDEQGHLSVRTSAMRAALESYLESVDYAPAKTLYWWSDSVTQFIEGNVAMISVFSNHAISVVNNQSAKAIALAGCASLPGGRPCLGGGCIGVSSQTERRDVCAVFFDWLYSEEVASLITMAGGMTPVASVFEDERLRALYPWLEHMHTYFHEGQRLHQSALYPHFDDYQFEMILGAAVRNLAMHMIGVDEAMDMIQTTCEQQFGGSK